MNPSAQAYADAANDAYKDRPKSQVDSDKRILLDGQSYQIFGYAENAATGFHATAYREVAPPHSVIIAYRGTDPDYKQHTRTAIQDAAIDYAMVKDRTNRQKPDADAFTQAMIEKAEKNGISKDHVTAAGHSLGGTFVELEASKFNLRGVSFNGYGAADLNYGVPQGGNQVTNYVMAGDVVSAGGHHFGEVKVLASVQDVAALRTGRYVDAPPGTAPPNPLLTVMLSDHSVTHFTGEGGMENMLTPASLAAGEARYLQYKPAFDRFREDVHQDRAELGAALRNADSRTITTTLAHLSPRLQQQLVEVHAVSVDAPIHRAIEQNRLMQGTGKAFDDTSSALRADGEHARQNAARFSDASRGAGHIVQQKAGDVAHASLGFSGINPLGAAGVALGATVVGYAARAEAEVLAQASHIAGRATDAVGQFAADQVQHGKRAVQAGAHAAAQGVTAVLHVKEQELVGAIDAALLVATATGAVVDGTTRAYGAARDAVSQGIGATIQAAETSYSALSHPGQWFGQPPAPMPTAATPAQVSAPTHPPGQPAPPVRTSDSVHALNDPRHPGNRDHGLYAELHRRIPDASDKRLLQFTDVCHTNRISVKNLGDIHLDEKGGQIFFATTWPPQAPAVVDLKYPSPDPQQSIKHIQQHDLQQAQNAQMNQQGQTQGGPQAPTR